MPEQRYYFHAGKGGVGKSTTSALSALHLAGAGKEVLLVSLDPAHNQADIFDMRFTERPRRIAANLRVAQADIDAWMKRYLKDVEKQIRRTYTYQTAFNLEKHLGILKYSPGIEEYALLLAFRHYRAENTDCDVIIFDMPPTALTTKFFNLPALSLLWIEQLVTLRKEILEKKKIITRIHLGIAEFECDKITSKLEQQQNVFQEIRQLFQDEEKCRINLVVNPDRLSFAEAERIEAGLKEMDIALSAIIMNKVAPGSSWNEKEILFTRNRVHPVPLANAQLIGLRTLSCFLEANPNAFAFLN